MPFPPRSLPRHPVSWTARNYLRKSDLTRDIERLIFAMESGIPTLTNAAELVAVDITGYDNGANPVYVTGLGIFQWDPTSTAAHDGTYVIRPDSIDAADPGRWVRPLPAAQINGAGTPGTHLFALADHVHPMAVSGSVDGLQIYYVGKHGSDSNNGKSIENAFLTFGKAFTEAAAQTPSASNQFVISCSDAGIYTEAVTMAQWVSLYAPAASLVGRLTVADDTLALFHSVEAGVGDICVRKPSGQTGISRVECNIIRATSDATGALTEAATGVLMVEARSVYAQNGYGIGEISTAQGHMHLMIEDLYITGTGGGIVRFGAGSTVGYVGHCLEIGGGVGNGTGLNIIGGELQLKMMTLNANQAYTVGAGGTLRLDANYINGAVGGVGPAYVNTAGYVAGTPANWAGGGEPSLNVAIDRLAAAVSGLLATPIP